MNKRELFTYVAGAAVVPIAAVLPVQASAPKAWQRAYGLCWLESTYKHPLEYPYFVAKDRAFGMIASRMQRDGFTEIRNIKYETLTYGSDGLYPHASYLTVAADVC